MLIPKSSSQSKLSNVFDQRTKERPAEKSKGFDETLKARLQKQSRSKAAKESAKKKLKKRNDEHGAVDSRENPSVDHKNSKVKVRENTVGSRTASRSGSQNQGEKTSVGREQFQTGKEVSNSSGEVQGNKELNPMSLNGRAVALDDSGNFLQPETLKQNATPLSNDLSSSVKNPEVQNLLLSQEAIVSENSGNAKLQEALQNIESSPELDEKTIQGLLAKSQQVPIQRPGASTLGGEKGENTSVSALLGATDSQAQSQSGTEFGNSEQSSQQDAEVFDHFVGAVDANSHLKGAGEGKSFSQALTEVQVGGKESAVDNMSSIVRQVRTMVKDGGGSMNIELSPEGMGNINLKVAVESGQVNVEMLADSQSAKKALEDGLFEMKASLEGQKLTVDNLKVELSKDYEKDFTQNQNFSEEQENRDFAQQFMEQFQREREERVGSLFNGLQTYMREPGNPQLELGSQSYFGKNKGKSINLVA